MMPVGQAGSPYEDDPVFMLGQAGAVLTRLEAEYQTALGEQASGHDHDSGTLNEVARRLGSAKAAYEELLQICEARAATAASATPRAEVTPKARVTPKAKAATQAKSVPTWVVEDAEGFDLRPDPLAARTPAELMAALRQYREWAGQPPYRKMASHSGRPIAASTLCTALNKNDLPPMSVVLAIVAGCGGGEEEQQRYATAWRQIKRGPALRVVPPIAGTA
jgi:hypothetical protein